MGILNNFCPRKPSRHSLMQSIGTKLVSAVSYDTTLLKNIEVLFLTKKDGVVSYRIEIIVCKKVENHLYVHGKLQQNIR